MSGRRYLIVDACVWPSLPGVRGPMPIHDISDLEGLWNETVVPASLATRLARSAEIAADKVLERIAEDVHRLEAGAEAPDAYKEGYWRAIEDVLALKVFDGFTTDQTQAEPLGEAPEIPTFEGTRADLDSLVSVRKGG